MPALNRSDTVPSLVPERTLPSSNSPGHARVQANASFLEEGQLICGRYLVGRLIGAGGMGLVHSATHIELGNELAIKVIRPQLSADPEILVRFLNEARAVAPLRSEHIARVFDAGKLDSGEAFLIMERLWGTDLCRLLARIGSLPGPLACDYVMQACHGLAEAHARGIVHRDLKPEHLFLAERPDDCPIIKILDFGISKRLFDDRQIAVTNPGDRVGSPCYMSPEQMQDPAELDCRSDIWALGVVLFELLAGKNPFSGEGFSQICWKVMHSPCPSVRQFRPDVDAGLDAIIEKCLQRDPKARFQSVKELALALAPYASPAKNGSPLSLRDELVLVQEAGELGGPESAPATLNSNKTPFPLPLVSLKPPNPVPVAVAYGRSPKAPSRDTEEAVMSGDLRSAGVPMKWPWQLACVLALVVLTFASLLGLLFFGGAHEGGRVELMPPIECAVPA